MTVEELIDELKRHPQTAPVFVGDEMDAIEFVTYEHGQVLIDLVTDDMEDDDE
jgi:hypothetical protein